ncbi:hypothetical protein AVEN_184844-1 [Araneus ventricosus]|uniref:CCHC-type domain-containing protein n=1 Tax=Araneus ventricosus TaxID=182803 RepID=A0A4Y2LAJ5_ARAVE|nr:hypothetical protein AVEN_184844-1 [Araneus ventricosus]
MGWLSAGFGFESFSMDRPDYRGSTDFCEKDPEEHELENSIRIESAQSLSEPSQHEELSRVTTASIAKVTAVLSKVKISLENKTLIQTELVTLTSVPFDKLAENGFLRSQVMALQSENVALNTQLRQAQKTPQTAPPPGPGPRTSPPPTAKTFASVLKQNSKKKPPPKHVSLVFAKDTATSPEEVKETLLKSLAPSKIKVGVRNVRKLTKGGVAVECSSPKDIEALIKEINSNGQTSNLFEARKPAKRKPRVIIYDVDQGLAKEELAKTIAGQNDLPEENFKLLFHLKIRNAGKCHWVLEADPKSFHKIRRTKKMYVEWQRLSVREFLRPTRCYKCNMFGHISTSCPNQENVRNVVPKDTRLPNARPKPTASTAALPTTGTACDTKRTTLQWIPPALHLTTNYSN